jgi:hypothetical protein
MVDEVVELSLLEVGLEGAVSEEDLATYPDIEEQLQQQVREALKTHFQIKICYQVKSVLGCSRRGRFPPEIVKRDYFEVAYGWDAGRKRFIALRRVKSWEEVCNRELQLRDAKKNWENLTSAATKNDVIVWRALRVHTGKGVEMDMMVRHILAKETEDKPAVKILKHWIPDYGNNKTGNAGFSHSGSSGGRCKVSKKTCGNCYNCQRPSLKRKCLGHGGTLEHAHADDEVRKRRQSIKREQD